MEASKSQIHAFTKFVPELADTWIAVWRKVNQNVRGTRTGHATGTNEPKQEVITPRFRLAGSGAGVFTL